MVNKKDIFDATECCESFWKAIIRKRISERFGLEQEYANIFAADVYNVLLCSAFVRRELNRDIMETIDLVIDDGYYLNNKISKEK